MEFPPSHPVRPLPANAAAWTRLANATRESHYVAWGPDVLVKVGSSKLVEAMPLLDFTERGGQKFLPLNVIVFFLGRLGWVEDRSLSIDLSAGLSPATLAKFEAWAVADKRLDWSPTSETGFLQRVLALVAELAAGPLSLVSVRLLLGLVGYDGEWRHMTPLPGGLKGSGGWEEKEETPARPAGQQSRAPHRSPCAANHREGRMVMSQVSPVMSRSFITL